MLSIWGGHQSELGPFPNIRGISNVTYTTIDENINSFRRAYQRSFLKDFFHFPTPVEKAYRQVLEEQFPSPKVNLILRETLAAQGTTGGGGGLACVYDHLFQKIAVLVLLANQNEDKLLYGSIQRIVNPFEC